MDQVVVKTEVQPNGDILLFYVDEHQDNILQTGQSNELLSDSRYVVEDFVEEDSPDEYEIAQATEQVAREKWQESDIKRLITFFIDNKETFLSGTTKKIHLWVVACKTMLTDKKPISCEIKLNALKKKYTQLCFEQLKGQEVNWPYFELCHQAFHDDSHVKMCLAELGKETVVANLPVQNVINQDGVFMVKKVNTEQNKDEKVEAMLSSYLKYKKMYPKGQNMQKSIWEAIAIELGEGDSDYWHKRFSNYKQHYIRILYKRQESGSESINWPYMGYFDQIYCDDIEFQQKFLQKGNDKTEIPVLVDSSENVWTDMEKTFLVKYYFDCFHEYQDPTIPKKFLWHEVGRLLDKKPETCQKMYEELKNAHFDILIAGVYDISERLPLAILFDNIIAKEAEIEIQKGVVSMDVWKVEQVDQLVEFVYNNIDLVKDSVCYYVCWATLAKKFQTSILSCSKQWDELTSLYTSVLEDKKEYPDMQITWRYIDIFDRIFDYGMDTNLLDGYKKFKEKTEVKKPGKVGAKKITIRNSDDRLIENGTDDEESYDERGFTKRSKKRNGDTKAFKILEYYLKNKEKFGSSQHKKLALWELLARQIGITATECAHRFRNFKQVYTGYVQREINKPEKPILWPYYTLCKKVFGYRAIKSKLKNGKIDSDDAEDWSAKEIKQLINYFGRNYNNLIDDVEESYKWTELAKTMGRTETNCCEKFLELRKSYRKLRTMKARNPDVKVSWKYFTMIDDIYKNGITNVEVLEEMDVDEMNGYHDDEQTGQEDDDFQCIIVIPEGEDINNAEIMIQDQNNELEAPKIEPNSESKQIITKWNRRSKKRLLIEYLKYLKAHKDQEINSKEMWTEIACKLDEKTPISCKKMFLKLKNQHKLTNDNVNTPYYNLMERILAEKSRIAKKALNQDLDAIKIFKDVQIDDDKVIKALQYYLQNLEDFVSPKFEQKYLWTELAKYISEPLIKVFNKINYLKQNFDNELDAPYNELLQEIVSKENALRDVISNDLNPVVDEDSVEEIWSDIEIERLLTWYLAHLDKFKNPKFVRSYLWMEASDILRKSPLVCSKKMLEIRSQYRTMVKENPLDLDSWKFYNLCQRIYGTGKKMSTSS